MTFCELLESLEIKSYPEKLESIYDEICAENNCIFNREYVVKLDEKYNITGKYFEPVIAAIEEIKTRKNLYLWLCLGCEYLRRSDCSAAKELPIPTSDGTLAMDMLPVLILLSAVPEAARLYEKRGFSEEQTKNNLSSIYNCIAAQESLKGRPMLDKRMYNWLCHYVKAVIFTHGGFNFQLLKWANKAIVLKSEKSGECAMVMLDGAAHRSGLVFGTVGCTDEKDSFRTEFAETADAYIAHAVKNGRIESERTFFKKSEWSCVLSSGDNTLALHIPKGANLTPEWVGKSLREGLELAKKHYPDFSPKFITCNSWLMDPKLVDILGPNANISKFNERFLKHPQIDACGVECIEYVWPKRNGQVEDYEENSTLQRGIKKLMLEGGHILAFRGVITTEL